LQKSSTVRVDKGVELFKTGAAPRIHFTGGLASPNAPSAGHQMAARAMDFGLPETAITYEGGSYSTLQNALFSKQDWQNADHIVLVTEGFHLPRSWATFKAFGADRITLVNARRFRGKRIKSGIRMTLREALAIWFNATRFLVPTLGHQRVMRALCHNLATLKHDDPIRPLNGGQTVRHHQRCSVL